MSNDTDTLLKPLFDRGLQIRREVLGEDYVEQSLRNANDLTDALQMITTSWCWGYAWGDETLDRKTRSLMNLALLTALGKTAEIKLHVRGAINNGLGVPEIRAALAHATIYCGVPAGLEAFKAASMELVELGVLPVPTTSDKD